jgi:outer membrane protein OmpA-like peptidoglycan-associated protein
LSQRRAEAIRMALGQMGIARARIETRGYGEAYPVASNSTAGERQMNRRVEIVLSEAGRPITYRR